MEIQGYINIGGTRYRKNDAVRLGLIHAHSIVEPEPEPSGVVVLEEPKPEAPKPRRARS